MKTDVAMTGDEVEGVDEARVAGNTRSHATGVLSATGLVVQPLGPNIEHLVGVASAPNLRQGYACWTSSRLPPS